MTDSPTPPPPPRAGTPLVRRRAWAESRVARWAVLFLASEEAGYITGHTLNVSGGLYI